MDIKWIKGIIQMPDKCDRVIVYHDKFNECYVLTGKELIDNCNKFNSITSIKWTSFNIEKLKYLIAIGSYHLPEEAVLK